MASNDIFASDGSRRSFASVSGLRRWGTYVALGVAVLLVAPSATSAAVFHVSDAPGLVAAIDGANQTPGADTIELQADVFLTAVHDTERGPTGTPKITSTIALLGNGFRISRPTAAPEFRLLHVSGSSSDEGDLTLDDVVLEGGDVSGVAPASCVTAVDACGGGLLNYFGRVVARNGTRFEENGAYGGGGLANLGGNVRLRDTTFLDDEAVRGGALYNAGSSLGDPATVVVESSLFEDCSTEEAGGAIENQGELLVSGSMFSKNRTTGAPGSGGAVHSSSFNGFARFVDTTFAENEAVSGGALANENAAEMMLSNSHVTLNRTVGFGGGAGLWNAGGALIIRDSRITLNDASGFTSDGGGILCGPPGGGGGSLELRNSVVSQNSASDDAGGIYLGSSSGASSIVASSIDFNAASGEGGGIYKAGASALTIHASSVSDNVNDGFNGGGIAVDGTFSSTPPDGVTITDSTIARNRLVTGDGGGISNDNQGIITIRGSTIVDNETTGVAAVGEGGGGVFSNSTFAMVAIVNSTITGNSVSGHGGGVKNTNASTMTLENVTLADNVAGSHGGGFMALTPSTFLRNSLVVGNTSTHATQQHNCGGFTQYIVDQGGNFTNDANGVCPAGFTVSQNVLLAALADNGGATQTRALLPGSVAIDVVPGCGESADQRGVPRDSLCDSGAYEGDVTVPLVRFTTSSSSVAEEPGGIHDASVLVDNRLGDVEDGMLEVHVGVSGTAADGSDFDLLTLPPLVFAGTGWPAPGTGASLPISLDVLRDFELEGAETIRLEITAGGIVGPAQLGSVPVHTVTIVDAVSDLRVEKTIELTDDAGTGGVVDPGDELTIVVAVTNHGPASAEDVTIEDLLDPSLLDLTTAAVTETLGSYDPLLGEWSADGDGDGVGFALAPGQTETLTIRATVLAGTAGQAISNTARVSPIHPPLAADPDASNDSSTAAIEIFGCRSTPAEVCTTGFPRGKILINEVRPGREKLVATWANGLPTTQADFGSPLDAGGTAYLFCLYDDTSELVAALAVDRAGDACGTRPCWRSRGGAPPDGKGYVYKDRERSSDGVDSIKVNAGGDGKTKLILKAQNLDTKGQSELPTGLAGALMTSYDGVTMQLLTSNAGCFSIELDEVVRRTPTLFKAKE